MINSRVFQEGVNSAHQRRCACRILHEQVQLTDTVDNHRVVDDSRLVDRIEHLNLILAVGRLQVPLVFRVVHVKAVDAVTFLAQSADASKQQNL